MTAVVTQLQSKSNNGCFRNSLVINNHFVKTPRYICVKHVEFTNVPYDIRIKGEVFQCSAICRLLSLSIQNMKTHSYASLLGRPTYKTYFSGIISSPRKWNVINSPQPNINIYQNHATSSKYSIFKRKAIKRVAIFSFHSMVYFHLFHPELKGGRGGREPQ